MSTAESLALAFDLARAGKTGWAGRARAGAARPLPFAGIIEAGRRP
ncbi:MAG: hypothetical protein ABW005_10950 [Burkholderiaceae bacterium]